MTVYALVTGTLFRQAEEKTSSKTGRVHHHHHRRRESGFR